MGQFEFPVFTFVFTKIESSWTANDMSIIIRTELSLEMKWQISHEYLGWIFFHPCISSFTLTLFFFLSPKPCKSKQSCHNWWTNQHQWCLGWVLQTSGCNYLKGCSTSPWESQLFCFCWHWASWHGRPTDAAQTLHTPIKAWVGI